MPACICWLGRERQVTLFRKLHRYWLEKEVWVQLHAFSIKEVDTGLGTITVVCHYFLTLGGSGRKGWYCKNRNSSAPNVLMWTNWIFHCTQRSLAVVVSSLTLIISLFQQGPRNGQEFSPWQAHIPSHHSHFSPQIVLERMCFPNLQFDCQVVHCRAASNWITSFMGK